MLTRVQSYLSNFLCSASGMNILFPPSYLKKYFLGVSSFYLFLHITLIELYDIYYDVSIVHFFFSARVVNHLQNRCLATSNISDIKCEKNAFC